MIDIRLVRAEPEELRRALARKGAAEQLDQLIEVDETWRRLTSRADELRSRTKLKGKPSAEERAELQKLKADLQETETALAEAGRRRAELLEIIPNPPASEVPDGATDEDAAEVKRVGEPRRFDFEVRDHVELGGFDLERGARLSGSRFAYRRGPVALVELALYRFALATVMEHGFEPVLPPVLVREEAMYGTGFLPTDEVNIYRVERDDLYLTGTSEVALASIHQGEILEEQDLPTRYAGYSTCFRREAGAGGRDTRGAFRVHQFDKVEMFAFTDPELSRQEHERILSIEEEIVQSLGLAYRVVCTAAGDLGPSASKKYDIEAWFPSQQRYREITSCSNTTDYQARRLNVRYRREDRSLGLVHTLNGTAMTARVLIALVETYQEKDGSVEVPQVLSPHGAPQSFKY